MLFITIVFMSQQGFPMVNVCYPGDEIPKWFNYKSKGPSMTIKLPPDWLNNKFHGFATCFTAAFKGIYSPYQSLAIDCHLHLKTIHGQSLGNVCYFPKWIFSTKDFTDGMVEKGSEIASSDHVFIICGHCKAEVLKKRFNCSDAIEASFNFQASVIAQQYRLYGPMDFEVKKCGVRMLYREESKKFSNTHNEYGLETLVCISDKSRPNRRSSRSAIIDFDIDLPYPKRFRRF